MPSFPRNGRLENAPVDKDEVEAIRATLRGERQAFARLVEKYQRPLYAVLRRLVRSHEDTDDLLQESFLRAYQNLETFDTGRPFYPWLYRIAVNLALSAMRRRKWQQSTDSLDLFPSTNAGPEKNAGTSEFHFALERAIAKLPAEQRTILLLRTREDMSYQELSETLGLEVGTVMSRLSRAREKLRTWMRPHLEK